MRFTSNNMVIDTGDKGFELRIEAVQNFAEKLKFIIKLVLEPDNIGSDEFILYSNVNREKVEEVFKKITGQNTSDNFSPFLLGDLTLSRQ